MIFLRNNLLGSPPPTIIEKCFEVGVLSEWAKSDQN